MTSDLLYLDSSALVKLVIWEAESDELERFLIEWPNQVSSTLAVVEVSRATRRASPRSDIQERARSILGQIGLLEIDAAVRQLAATLEPATVRTLDAIHVATALSIADALGSFVTYDRRSSDAARAAGLMVQAPGSDGS